MRLTLRTLLAYLDDTLEPHEIKEIGQKVAESDAAQELIARIKQVTRRRRLTSPPDGGPGQDFDPNIIAAYLDNELDGDKIAEIEKKCLESDVHLAEIAACHQILTLVLGEPALVPPTAKQRMYGLLEGRKSKRTTKVTVAAAPAADAAKANEQEGDEPLILGLPLFRRAPWLRWALPSAAVVLLIVLCAILWKNLSGPDRPVARPNGDPAAEKNADEKKPDEKAPDEKKPDDKKPVDDKKTDEKKTDEKKPDDKKPVDEKKPDDKKPDDKKTDSPMVVVPPPVTPASMEVREAGKLESKGGRVLVRRDKAKNSWERVTLGGPVFTGEPLVSLPGYQSELRLAKNVNLTLWGNLRELLPEQLFLESSVTLHDNPALDLEFTLHRGRVFVTNTKDKGPATVRVRFQKDEVWDVTLEEPDSTFGIELWSWFRPQPRVQEGEQPFVQVFLYVARGKASAKVNYSTYTGLKSPPGQALLMWDNKGQGLQGPISLPTEVPAWNVKQSMPAKAQGVAAALDELTKSLTNPEKKLEIALYEFMEDPQFADRQYLGVLGLAAIDAVDLLVEAMGKEDQDNRSFANTRWEAFFALRHWFGQSPDNAKRLYDREKETGLLVTERKFSPKEAETFVHMLYPIPLETRRLPELYEYLIANLRNRRLEIREQALRHLLYLYPDGRKIAYNPSGDSTARQTGYEAWRKLLMDGKLPPPEPKPTGPMQPMQP